MTKLATKHVYYRGTKEKAFALQNERSKRLLEHYETSKLFDDTEEAYDNLREKIDSLYHMVKSKNKDNYLDLIFEIAHIEEAVEVFHIKLNEEYDEMNSED
jgi:hypothetical protein